MMLQIGHAKSPGSSPVNDIEFEDGKGYEGFIPTWTYLEDVNEPVVIEFATFTEQKIAMAYARNPNRHWIISLIGWDAKNIHDYTDIVPTINSSEDSGYHIGFTYWRDSVGRTHAAAYQSKSYLLNNDGKTIRHL